MTLNTCIKQVQVVVDDEVTNYLVTIPLHRGTSHEVGETLINHIFCKHGSPSYLIFDEDQAFLASVMQYIYKRLGIRIRLGIKIKTISPCSHG